MCGIAGLINKGNLNLEENIKRMTQIISHRGPDAEDFFINDKLAFGHRRLSIIDLSDQGKQPMTYQNRYTIIYNGEIYNFKELKEILTKLAYKFHNNTDTEVIIAAYDYWGEECLNRFNGMWSFALYDNQENKIFCSRDRFGVKPFYYYDKPDYFAFGSEIKQFTVLPEWKAVLNKQTAYDFLSWSFSDTSDESFFQGVKQLQGGYSLSYSLKDGNYSIKKWYELKISNKKEADFETLKMEFFDLLKSSVRYRLISDVKVGSCLSGGMDSTSIVMLVNGILNEQDKMELQETVSACSDNEKYDESKYIDLVVNRAKCKNHKVFPAYNDLKENLDKIIWHQDEPFGSSSIFAQWNVFKTAKENNITVMLDGQGSDEILAGYMQFYGALLTGKLSRSEYISFLQEVKNIKALHNFSNKDIFKFMMNVFLTGDLYNKAVNAGGKLGDKWLDGNHHLSKNLAWKKKNLSLSTESIEQLFCSKLPVLLHNEDRNAMAFSIESRVPFLDYRIVEFALSLPEEFKINKGRTKYILREAMQGILPEAIINRYDKMAFVTPEEIWVKENPDFFLSEIQETLKLTNGFIKADTIQYFKKVISGQKKFDFTLFRFISFGRWLKLFKVSIE